MSTTYTYSISADTANGRAAPDSLEVQINDSSISTGVLETISAGSTGPDVLAITFDLALSAPDKATLDGVVAAHQGGFIPPEGESAGYTFSIMDKDLATPPGGPAVGDMYIVPSGATGVWAGKTSQITEWDGISWNFRKPTAGVAAWVDDEAVLYLYEEPANVWVTAASQYITDVSDPTVNDDDTAGYQVGAQWVNTNNRKVFVLIDNTTGNADWRNVGKPIRHNLLFVGISGDVDFTSIKAAVDAAVAAGASNSNPFLITCDPGIYTETNPITVPAGVTISSNTGDRTTNVIVEAATATDYLFNMTAGTLLGLTLQGVSDPTRACIKVANVGQPSVIRNCAVQDCAVGMEVSGGANPLVSDFVAGVTSPGLTIMETAVKVTGSGTTLFLRGSTFSVPTGIPALYADNPMETAVLVESGAQAHLTNINCVIFPKNSTQAAIRADTGALVVIIGGNFDSSHTPLQIKAGGSNTQMSVFAADLSDNTTDVEILSATGNLFANFSTDTFTSNIVAGATFTAMVQERSSNTTIIVGNTSLQYGDTGKRLSLEKFAHDQQSSGLVSGGVVTDGGLLTANVAAGTGWIQRNSSNDDAFNVSWNAALGLVLTALTTNYIFYNGNTDAITVSTSPPGSESIGLAAIVTSATGIRYIHTYTNLVEEPDWKLHQYLLATRKIRHKNGLAPSAGTTNRNIDVGSGAYYRALTEITFAGAADATFSYFYGTDAVVEIPSQTLVDILLYDLLGTLTSMTAGFFRSDTLILTSDGRINLLYGTEEFDTQSLAEQTATIPPIPTFMEQSGFRICRLIVEQGNGIVSIVDERVDTMDGGETTPITVHGNLSGLGADDHTQYLLVDGSRAMSGSLNMGGNNVTNVNLVDGVDVSAHASRHNPGGADAVATASPPGTSVQVGNTAAEGSAASFARSDHVHTVTGATPVSITDSTNAAGSASTFVRSDHQHAHGNRGGGSLHALVTTSVAGFMSAADKTKLDGLVSQVGGTQFSSTGLSTTLGIFQDAFPLQNITVPATGNYLIMFGCNVQGSSGNTVNEIAVSRNVIVIADSQRLIQGNGGASLSAFCHTFVSATAGDIITGVWRKNAGSGTSSVGNRRISLIRLSITP